MASENFLRVIPSVSDPWVAVINGKKYVYPAGTEQYVPAEVAVLIDAQNEHEKPKYPPAQGGGDMLVTITVVMAMDVEAEPQFVADKTFEEIESAVNAGKNVRVKIPLPGPAYNIDSYIPLVGHVPGNELAFVSNEAGAVIIIHPDGIQVQLTN